MKKINTSIDVHEYKNGTSKLVEFVKTRNETVDELKKMLNSGDVKEFMLACNYIEEIDYASTNGIICEEMQNLSFSEKGKLVSLANKRVREQFGEKFSELFDKIVEASKQERWGGDELYKLYTYDCIPYYVTSCIKTALSVMAMMAEGIITVDDVMTVSYIINSPLYWDIYDKKAPNETESVATTKNRIVWCKMAVMLWDKKFKDAFNYMQAIMKKTSNRFGDNFDCIKLEYTEKDF